MEIILMDRVVKVVSYKTYLKRLLFSELVGLTESEKRMFINKRMHGYPEDIFNRSIHLTVSLRLSERGTAFIRYVNAEKSSTGSGDINDLRDTVFFMTLYNYLLHLPQKLLVQKTTQQPAQSILYSWITLRY